MYHHAMLPRLLLVAAAVLVPSGQEVHELPADDVPLRVELEDAFVVGAETGADHEILFGLVDVAFAPDGELYILEERNHRVLVYGPDGGFRRSFGREGEGPGEFQLPMSLAITGAGEVVVWDYGSRQWILFDREGGFLRQVSWPSRQLQANRDSLHPWPGGGVVYLPTELHQEGDPPELLERTPIVLERLGDTGAPEELLQVRHPRRRAQTIGEVMSLSSGPDFGVRAHFGVLPDGRLAVVDSADYRIRLVRPDEGSVAVIERPIPPRPVSEEERERRRAERRASLENPAGTVSFGGGGGGGLSEGDIRRLVEAMEFADVVPVVRDLRVDHEGRLWVQRHGATVFDPGPIDVVTADGRYLGTLAGIALPDAFGPGGSLAYMEGGRDVDVERVVVRRLPPGSIPGDVGAPVAGSGGP